MSTPAPGPRPALREASPCAVDAAVRPSTRERLAVGLRAAVALLVLAALAWSTVQAVQDGVLAQHVSFFTNQSNLLFALLLVASAALPHRRRPPWWDDVRGATAYYLMMTGIIYALLVAPLDELLRWEIGRASCRERV